ncbi:hypothetical protein MNB_SV-15-503 [hydrothermal vent metagenome]|uniref:Uncharacterized protein n=1 Tax=hydrothermal vent metagenome TaxID=652676 RepID=A0A1W1EJ12_9ZZZZ
MNLEEFLDTINEEDLRKINEEYYKKHNKIPTYQYSKIRDKELEALFDIEQKLAYDRFDEWFNNDIELSLDTTIFLEKLLEEERDYIQVYNEEDLKMRFLSPILRLVNFKTKYFRDFYDEKLIYKSDKFILNGEVDFIISTGLRKAKKPYFFIQEFKRSEEYGNPRPQLLSELISAIELNMQTTMRGAYIVGESWNFVILEKLDTNKYQYFISRSFNSTKIEDLQDIYRNLMFVKFEIIKEFEDNI